MSVKKDFAFAWVSLFETRCMFFLGMKKYFFSKPCKSYRTHFSPPSSKGEPSLIILDHLSDSALPHKQADVKATELDWLETQAIIHPRIFGQSSVGVDSNHTFLQPNQISNTNTHPTFKICILHTAGYKLEVNEPFGAQSIRWRCFISYKIWANKYNVQYLLFIYVLHMKNFRTRVFAWYLHVKRKDLFENLLARLE